MARSGSSLTETQWKKIAPLLPRLHKYRMGGRPWTENRRMFEGILWILLSGVPWQNLPDNYPHPSQRGGLKSLRAEISTARPF
jgi:transposase